MIRPDDLVSLSDLLANPHRARPRRVSWRSGWSALLIASFSRAVLAILVGLVFWSLVPLFTGWHPSVVMTGSMEPALHPGDVVVTRAVPENRLRPGQIVLVDDPDRPGRLRLHRLVGFDPNGRLILRGDANSTADSDPVSIDNVRGVGVLRVPTIGRPIRWIHDHEYLPLAGVGIGVSALFVLATCYRATDPEPRPSQRGASSKVLTRGATIVVLLAVTAGQLVHATPAHAALSAKASNTSSWAVKYFSCKSAVLASTPNLYYRFEETSGTTAADSSSTGLTGTYSSAGITYRTAGACPYDAGKSITLDGSSGYVYMGTQVANPGTFSSEIWFKTTTTRGGWLIGFGSSATGASTQNDRQLYMTNSGQICFGILSSGAKEILSPASYNNGAWHQAVSTFSAGTGMRLYVDGNLVASNATVTSAHTYNGYIRIGYDSLSTWPSASTSSYFAGSIDEVAAYGTVLTATDVANHYAAGT